jgi:hypothetical protein
MEILLKYLNLGFTHVIPFGFDHVLFIICISLACKTPRALLIQCTVFTLAHSISLGLTSASLINPDTSWIEPLIAISILFASLENILGNELHRLRVPLIFIFGLIHGMGFAGALRGAGIPDGHFFTALLGFNAGVECGQILVILAVWLPAIRWMQRKEWYASRMLYPVSSLIACIAFYWTLKRLAHS